jgi:hypothetical protein
MHHAKEIAAIANRFQADYNLFCEIEYRFNEVNGLDSKYLLTIRSDDSTFIEKLGFAGSKHNFKLLRFYLEAWEAGYKAAKDTFTDI